MLVICRLMFVDIYHAQETSGTGRWYNLLMRKLIRYIERLKCIGHIDEEKCDARPCVHFVKKIKKNFAFPSEEGKLKISAMCVHKF